MKSSSSLRSSWSNLRSFQKDPLAFLRSMQGDGDVSTFSLGVRRGVIVTGDAVAEALDHPALLRARVPLGPLRTFGGLAPMFRIIGEGLPLLNEGVKDRRRHVGAFLAEAQRPAIPPSRDVDARLRAIVLDEQRRADGAVVDLSRVVARHVCEDLCLRSFGNAFAERAGELTEVLEQGSRAAHQQAVGVPLWSAWCGPHLQATSRARTALEAFANDLLNDPQAATMPAVAALSSLPHALQVDELITQLLAGIETTTLSICWTIWLLAAHPPWHASVVDEVTAGQRLDDLRWSGTEASVRCVREALRLYPSFWQLFRVAQVSCRIGAADIDAGDVVFVSLYQTHRDPRRHPAPDAFEPLRDDVAATFAFGAGSRSCIGARLAFSIIMSTLSSCLRSCRVTPTELERPLEPLVYGLWRRGGFPAHIVIRRRDHETWTEQPPSTV